MADPNQHHAINYIEFATTSIERTRAFYSRAFGWSFQDWGPDYISFDLAGAGIDGGFRKAEEIAGAAAAQGPLVVLYSNDLEASQQAVEAAGGTIVVPIFEFPGGRRFHFSDGAGNTLAVWGR